MEKTRFLRTIVGITTCAVLALFYAHQQVELLKTSFLINKHHHEVTLLLDQYRYLVYNLSRLESPGRIENTLSVKEITLCMPKKKNIRQKQNLKL
ncbi:MAG: hypothetical protein WBC74_00485 [Candidatus Omnitrophota bacterium]